MANDDTYYARNIHDLGDKLNTWLEAATHEGKLEVEVNVTTLEVFGRKPVPRIAVRVLRPVDPTREAPDK